VCEDDVALVEAVYEAFARRDLAALLDVLHPQIEWIEPPGDWPFAGLHRGHEELLAAVLVRLPDDSELLRTEPDEFLQAGEQVVVLGHHRGRSPGGGAPFEVPFAHIWTMRDGAAVRFRSYVDGSRFAALVL
jgi:ketosteroid isomerase-like protein